MMLCKPQPTTSSSAGGRTGTRSRETVQGEPSGLKCGGLRNWSAVTEPCSCAAFYRSRCLPRLCSAIRPDLKDYAGGDSPRRSLDDQVYSSSEYPEELEVLLHNELSYAAWWPQRLFFSCLKPASSGGETHIADGRAVYRNIPDRIQEKFETLGVHYHQHFRTQKERPESERAGRTPFRRMTAQSGRSLAAAGPCEWTTFTA